jgi:hypothetical protein
MAEIHEGNTAGCDHRWDDRRAVSSDQDRPPMDSDFVECKLCGAPLQLARRRGIWYNPTNVHEPGPPWVYGP